MNENLPHDSDGDALRRLIDTGSNLNKEMEIDFAMTVPGRDIALIFSEVANLLNFRTRISHDSVTGDWTCLCSRTMLPSYDAIIEIQKVLENAGRLYNATPDGWGSFGNAE